MTTNNVFVDTELERLTDIESGWSIVEHRKKQKRRGRYQNTRGLMLYIKDINLIFMLCIIYTKVRTSTNVDLAERSRVRCSIAV